MKKNKILQLVKAGRLDEIPAHAKKYLSRYPADIDVLTILGVTYVQLGIHSSAENVFKRILILEPDNIQSSINLANIYVSTGRFRVASELFSGILSKKNDHVGALIGLAYCQYKNSDLEASLTTIAKAEKTEPLAPEVLNTKAVILDAMGQGSAAEEIYRLILKSTPLAPAILNLSKILLDKGRPREARDLLLSSRIDERYMPFDTNLTVGRILTQLEDYSEALHYFDKCFSLDPQNPQLFAALLNYFSNQRDHESAHTAAIRLGDLAKGSLESFAGSMLMAYANVCDLPNVDKMADVVKSEYRLGTAAVMPLHACTVFDDVELQFQSAKTEVKRYDYIGARRKYLDSSVINLGYLSGDLRDHAVGHLVRSMFGLHNRQRFSVTAFSNHKADSSEVYGKIYKDVDNFFHVEECSDDNLVDMFDEKNIDILIDLSGHTSHNRLSALARAKAPISVTYLGYPGSTGLSSVDYIFADSFVLPKSNFRFFSETVIHLPASYQMNDRDDLSEELDPIFRLHGLEDKFIYCSFNSVQKYNSKTFNAWAEILSRTPESVLWILAPNSYIKSFILKEFSARGLSEDRLVFASSAPHGQHLARLKQAHLMLDSFPYNAHTTASDILRAGVPIVTLSGESFPSRVAGSLMATTGLAELITTSWADYISLAVRCATDGAFYDRIRIIAGQAHNSILFDTEFKVRALEVAYLEMTRQRRAGVREPFSVDQGLNVSPIHN